jgi:hypothetical protein
MTIMPIPASMIGGGASKPNHYSGKQDRSGTPGETIAIARGDIACPVKALREWLDAAGLEAGPLFRPINKAGTVAASRLTCRSVANIIKAYAARAGFDASTFSGHSLRSGFLTSAAGKGASIFKMMDVSRHKSVDTLRATCATRSYSRIMRGPGCCKGAVRRCRGAWQRKRHFLLGLMEPTIALHGPRCLGILHGPVLCLGILLGPDLSVLLHGPDLRPCIFLGRPSLVLLEQGFGWWLRIFGLTLRCSFKSGSNFVAGRRLRCSRRQSLNADG